MTVKKINAQTPLEELPADVNTLRQMVLTLLSQIDDLSGQLHYLKRQLFGKKSEKLDPNQGLLFEELYEELQGQIAAEAKAAEEEAAAPAQPAKRRRNNHKGRCPLPPDLPRQSIEVDIPEAEKVCPVCHQAKQRIGEEVTEKLEYEPASFYVKSYVRPKYACPQCCGQVSIGSLPPMAIDKGIPGEGLLAHVLCNKYCDHLPLYRQARIFQREKIDISVSTLCDWVGRSADLLTPLVDRMHEKLLLSPKVNTDDTPVKVQDPARVGSTSTGYLWVYIDIDYNVVFDFTRNRSREGPLLFLSGFHGYVQADAYSGYDAFFRSSDAVEVGCHAHARRKFEYALDSNPVQAAHMLALYSRLYEIESQAKAEKYSPEQLLAARQSRSLPILGEMKELLDKWQGELLPRSPMGKAVTYCQNQWQALLRYTEDPILEIDNNLSERTLRMVAIGRKNYLFFGSEAGGQRAAIIYSLVASCKLHGLDPFAYFRDVLARVSTHPASRIDELLPCQWDKSRS